MSLGSERNCQSSGGSKQQRIKKRQSLFLWDSEFGGVILPDRVKIMSVLKNILGHKWNVA